MNVLAVVLVSLFSFFAAVVGMACCKLSGDCEEDAQGCFERWLKSKGDEDSS